MEEKVLAGRFLLKDEIASRPACTVYVAEDRSLAGMEVAVKVFTDRPRGAAELIAEFEREVLHLRAATHPTLVPIVAGGYDADTFFLAMEMIRGDTLRDLLKLHDGRLEIGEAVQIAVQLGEALAELHKNDIVHAHLDSRAVLFKNREPRLAGFCPRAVEKLQRAQTSAGRVLAEPAYLAPEQVSGSVALGPGTDVYALAVLLFEMLTGGRPFSGSSAMQTAMMHLSQAPPSPAKLRPEISPLIDAAILKGMAKDPKERFATCLAFVDAVTAGQKIPMNPLADAAASVIGTETIAVSMSTDAIRDILKRGSASSPPPAPPKAQPPPPPSSVTALEMRTSDVLPGSLMIVEGPRRGERFSLAGEKVIVGSDPTCDLRVDGRGMPSRYAIVVRRGEQFVAAPLSGSPVTINGEGHTGDVALQRGDIIAAGGSKLRFIAPGEVFTLQENVADRVIDRPKSRVPMLLGSAVAVLAVVGLGLTYLYQGQAEKIRIAQQQESAARQREREELMKMLLQEGDELFRSGALTLPVGANAEEKFRAVLEVKPDHSYAKRRLYEIETRVKELSDQRLRDEQLAGRLKQFLADGERYLDARQLISPPGKNAKESFEQALKVDPSNTRARDRIAEINRILSDQLSRVQETLAAARSHREAGRFAQPPGGNALDLLRQVLDVDPKNFEARNMVLDMAAQSIYNGDREKRLARSLPMKQAYLTAKLLGVDPKYIADRLRGIELIRESKAEIMVVDRKSATPSAPGDSQYLDTAEVERRVAALALAADDPSDRGGKRFIDLSQEGR